MTYIDTRDLAKLADEIRDALEMLEGGLTLDGERDESALEALDCSTGIPEDDEQIARDLLAELESLAEEITEWDDGATLIPEDEFEDYARELAEDIGAIDRDAGWPLMHIDWEAAADALKQDYAEVTYQGTTYLVRD
jgi:hypothetical protein